MIFVVSRKSRFIETIVHLQKQSLEVEICCGTLSLLYGGSPPGSKGYFVYSYSRMFARLCMYLSRLRSSWAEWQRLSEVRGRYLNEEHAQELSVLGHQCLLLHSAASWTAASQNIMAWLCVPKLHLMDHLNADTLKYRYNFRFWANWTGEDMMGSIKKLCIGLPAQGLEVRVLKRCLLRVHAAKSIWIRGSSCRKKVFIMWPSSWVLVSSHRWYVSSVSSHRWAQVTIYTSNWKTRVYIYIIYIYIRLPG